MLHRERANKTPAPRLPSGGQGACWLERLEGRTLLAVNYVIDISVDGFRPDAVTQLGASQLPNFYRLRTQGAFTDNARTDFDVTITLPNHTDMVTGRPQIGENGHAWTINWDPAPGETLHSIKGSYIASVWDVAHDNGLRTGLYASKTKFSLYTTSYDVDTEPLQGGAPDVTGADNGRQKIDYSNINFDQLAMTNALIADMTADPMEYSLVHFGGTDGAGHSYGWMSVPYLEALKAIDARLGQIFQMIDTTPALTGSTAIILTTDHAGNGFGHDNIYDPLDYTIPFYVWGPGVTPGADLYGLNSTIRQNPGAARPDYSQPLQPIRNGEAGNLALSLLGLPAIPGSFFDFSQNLRVGGPVGSGLNATYFNNVDLTSPAVSRIDPAISFDWLGGSPDPLIAPGTFSAQWSGQIQPFEPGSYTFITKADDGVRLWVNNQLLIDRWADVKIPGDANADDLVDQADFRIAVRNLNKPGDWSKGDFNADGIVTFADLQLLQQNLGQIEAPVANQGSINLLAGFKYNIKMEYYQRRAGAAVKLEWITPSLIHSTVPQQNLYPAIAASLPAPAPAPAAAIASPTAASHVASPLAISSSSSRPPLKVTAPARATPAAIIPKVLRPASRLSFAGFSTTSIDRRLPPPSKSVLNSADFKPPWA